MKRRRPNSCLVFLLLLAALAVAGWWYLQNGPYQIAESVSPEIAAFTGQSGAVIERLRYNDTPDGRVGQYRSTLANGGTAYFDVDPGQNVVGYFLAGQNANQVVLSKDQAITLARQFAAKHYPDAALLNQPPESAVLVATQEDNRYYQIEWVKRDPATNTRLPQTALVQVNAKTGVVIGYQRVYVTELPAIRAGIARAAASNTALTALQTYLNQPEVVQAELSLLRAPVGDPKAAFTTVWQVSVRGAADATGVVPQAIVLVDAATGKLIQIIPLQ